jgi:hypothetical protein
MSYLAKTLTTMLTNSGLEILVGPRLKLEKFEFYFEHF